MVNGKVARRLRKRVDFHPKDDREYSRKEKEVKDENGEVTKVKTTICICTCERRDYQQAKREYNELKQISFPRQ